MIIPLVYVKAHVLYQTLPETVTLPAKVKLLDTYQTVQPVLCQVPHTIVIAVHVIIPFVVVSIPFTVTVLVTVVSVKPVPADKVQSRYMADVNVSDAVAAALMLYQCILAVGVLSV